MVNIQRIVCPTDLSPASRPAWDTAQVLGRLTKAELLLVHAVPPQPIPMEGYVPPDLYQRMTESEGREVGESLDRWVAGTDEGGLTVTRHVERGSPAARIVALAEAESADLIVMGTHRRAGLDRLVLGSVADRVIRTAPCPVVTVRAGVERPLTDRLSRIVYATDFSPTARAAWPYALILAEAAGAAVDLVHLTPEVIPDRHLPTETLGAMARMLREQGVMQAERFLKESGVDPGRVQLLVSAGVAAEQILRAATSRRADLVVMGTHGWSGLVRWMLGSVAQHVIQASPCPVLTVGPKGQPPGASHAG